MLLSVQSILEKGQRRVLAGLDRARIALVRVPHRLPGRRETVHATPRGPIPATDADGGRRDRIGHRAAGGAARRDREAAVAASGAWASDSTFVLDHNEVGNINVYRFRLTFSEGGVTVEFSERSGALADARFRGRSSRVGP